jgi:hypothetical protein
MHFIAQDLKDILFCWTISHNSDVWTTNRAHSQLLPADIIFNLMNCFAVFVAQVNGMIFVLCKFEAGFEVELILHIHTNFSVRSFSDISFVSYGVLLSIMNSTIRVQIFCWFDVFTLPSAYCRQVLSAAVRMRVCRSALCAHLCLLTACPHKASAACPQDQQPLEPQPTTSSTHSQQLSGSLTRGWPPSRSHLGITAVNNMVTMTTV